ncbi:MAG: hypothetical protein ABFQ95_04515 [Pseudomonadota bacterium]
MMKAFLFTLMLGFCVSEANATLRSITFDDVLAEGGFNAPTLSNVSQLRPGPNPLNNQQKDQLVQSKTLNQLRVLSVRNCDFTDAHIRNLTKNPTFSRLFNLDISQNIRIGDNSLDYILDSDVIASIRDLPQISGRYGIPSSEVYLQTDHTAVTSDKIREITQEPRQHFYIRYLDPNGNQTASDVPHGLKWIQKQ